jgi:hypothetical protein
MGNGNMKNKLISILEVENKPMVPSLYPSDSRSDQNLISALTRMLKLIYALVFGVLMSACSGTEKWKEEVQLSDGKIIVIDRETLREGGGDEWASNRSGSKPKEYRVKFSHTSAPGKIIEWRSTKTSPQTWPEKPLLLDLESAQPAVFSIVAISAGCEIYSKYVYENNVWIEAALTEEFATRTSNLFIGGGVDMPNFIDLAAKRRAIDDGGYRDSLKQVGPAKKVCGG